MNSDTTIKIKKNKNKNKRKKKLLSVGSTRLDRV
jgi:hypothetical protein